MSALLDGVGQFDLTVEGLSQLVVADSLRCVCACSCCVCESPGWVGADAVCRLDKAGACSISQHFVVPITTYLPIYLSISSQSGVGRGEGDK